MNKEKLMKHRQTHFLIKVALHAATLVAAICAVTELERLNRRMKKFEKAHGEKHRKLL